MTCGESPGVAQKSLGNVTSQPASEQKWKYSRLIGYRADTEWVNLVWTELTPAVAPLRSSHRLLSGL
jgi:hypothetical protein